VLGRDDPSYRALTVAGGFTLPNRGQHLLARFGARGIEVRSGRALLGLSLSGYGYGVALQAVAPASPRAQANRVVYERGKLREWYANGPLGLEQGFTLAAPPARRAGPLTLALALSGNVRGSLSSGGEAVTFDAVGGVALVYRGLVATDARGRTLPSRLELRRGGLLVRIDDAGARYPLRIDPFIQQAKLTAAEGASENLGSSVAVSGETIVAGAPHANVGANTRQGAAYVFIKPAAGWADANQTAKLTASDGAAYDYLGSSVAVSGDTIVAGAPTVNATKKQGEKFPGAAYVFVKPAAGWADATQTAKLSNGAEKEELGNSVAVSGDTIVAGASSLHPGFTFPGAAYVFVKPEAGWADATQTAKLTASDKQNDYVGSSVAVSGDTIVAGAPGTSVVAAGQGAAYVFVKPEAGWANATETARLTNSNGGEQNLLGSSVAVSDDTIVAGAPTEPKTGANPLQGAAYVFVKPLAGWASATQTARLTASDGAAFDSLGSSVAVSGDTIVAGAKDAKVGESVKQGAAYTFVKPAAGWADATETVKLTASDGAGGDELGFSVAVSGETIVAGAPGAKVGGNFFQGAAYVFGPAAAGAPTVTNVNPAEGPEAGGTPVTITGTNLAGATDIKFGGNAATGVSCATATECTATSPAGAGLVDVTITTLAGTSATSAADRFTYLAPLVAPTVTNVNPAEGPEAGGTPVTITGTGFVTGATVMIGGAATEVNVVSETEITGRTAAGTGSHEVVVSDDGGTSTFGPTYTYLVSAPSPHTLEISLAGAGSGTVTGTGISCPGACSHSYPSGTMVTLTATPAAGSTFAAWSGGGCSGSVTCAGVTMSSDQNVTATFTVTPSAGGNPLGGNPLSGNPLSGNPLSGNPLGGSSGNGNPGNGNSPGNSSTQTCPGSTVAQITCQATQSYTGALAQCAKQHGKAGARCRKKAKLAYHKALAIAKCQSVKTTKKHTSCIQHARKLKA
jgi:hypothetical protein